MNQPGFTCGVWPERRARALVAVIVDEDNRAQTPQLFARGPDEVWAILASLDASIGLDCELVLPDWLANFDDVSRFAIQRGATIWLVPQHILQAVHIVANLGVGPPARTAAALARLPLAPALRAHLKRLGPLPESQRPAF